MIFIIMTMLQLVAPKNVKATFIFQASRKGSTEDLGLFIETSCVPMEFKRNTQKKFVALSKFYSIQDVKAQLQIFKKRKVLFMR